MSLTLPDCHKFTVSRTGLAVHQDLSFEEWSALAPRLNEASRCVAFLIGDWLIYGDARFNNGNSKLSRRVRSEDYERVVAATGLDRSTLQTYAYVARKVPFATRLEAHSWEHHKAVPKLKGNDQLRWLRIVSEADGAVSSRRLRKSITAGRLLSLAELKLDPADCGIPNHIPHINRLRAWWEDMKRARWLERATKAQRATLKRDLMPVIDIFEQL
jgi:hypothetical protein